MAQGVVASATNYWRSDACAKAFWAQKELPVYDSLRRETVDWLDPQPGERWVDLGCGSGALSLDLWHKSGAGIRQIVGIDCAAANDEALAAMRRDATPPMPDDRYRFIVDDFNEGLSRLEDDSVDGVVSGLAIHYAESTCPDTGRWTTEAYDRVFREVARVLRPGGQFVFTVNVPNSRWSKIAVGWLRQAFRSQRPVMFLQRGARMWIYGQWLLREVAKGRFHYVPWEHIQRNLTDGGFDAIEHKLGYKDQAFLVRSRKRAALKLAA